MGFVANFIRFVAAEKCWKSVKIILTTLQKVGTFSDTVYIHSESKKLHNFIFATILSNQSAFKLLLAHIYLNEFATKQHI